MNDGSNDNFGNLLNLISILLGYENLMENRQQSAENNISKSNQEQAKKYLMIYTNNLMNKMLC